MCPALRIQRVGGRLFSDSLRLQSKHRPCQYAQVSQLLYFPVLTPDAQCRQKKSDTCIALFLLLVTHDIFQSITTHGLHHHGGLRRDAIQISSPKISFQCPKNRKLFHNQQHPKNIFFPISVKIEITSNALRLLCRLTLQNRAEPRLTSINPNYLKINYFILPYRLS